MSFLRATALVALIAATVSAQSSTCSNNYWASDCFNAGCRWCSSSYQSDSGSCISSTALCSTSSYSTQVSNPCASLTTQSACTGNPVCGWCSSTTGSAPNCMWNGFYTTSTPNACSGTWTTQSCSKFTTQMDCYNSPSAECSWCASTSTCSYLGCSEYNDCTSTTSLTCTSYSVMWSYNTGSCGWCTNYYGTNQGRCLNYASGQPSQCTSGFTYNNNYNGAAVAAAVGLVGAVLIIVIVAPLVVCACVIGCSVYWCCIRPRNQTTVVVTAAQPGYAPMPAQQQPMNAYAQQPGAYPPPKTM